jgi:hypothetical protein
VFLAAMVRMSGNWSAKIPGSKKASCSRPQSATTASQPRSSRVAA